MYVMSVREPSNFFSHREFSLIPGNQETTSNLSKLHRHDLVCVQGDIIANSSPQKHIALNSLKVIEPQAQPEGYAPYSRQADLPEKLKEQISKYKEVAASILIVKPLTDAANTKSLCT